MGMKDTEQKKKKAKANEMRDTDLLFESDSN